MDYSTPYQLRLPLDLEKIIDLNDPIYTFSEVMDHIDLSSYFVEKGCRMGRPRCDAVKLLKIVLFAFMEGGYETLRQLEKLCKTDIRYMWLLDGMPAPSHITFGSFLREELSDQIEDLFLRINQYIFEKEGVDLEHAYIDGTKIEANANCYSWVWKKSSIKNRDKVFALITELIGKINSEVLLPFGVKIETRNEYAVEYIEQLLKRIVEVTGSTYVSGKGHRKTTEQRYYQKLEEYGKRLKQYAMHVQTCGDHRNSYSKTDPGATFFRMKRDHMGNDRLLPGYNMQMAICDEYIATVDVQQYASDMDCFVPLMEKFYGYYGKYPTYPVADAGYGSYNNYLYCEEHGMEKYLKFTMYEKTVKDKAYRENPFHITNFKTNEQGNLVCPNGKACVFKKNIKIVGNKYGRTEEVYECEDCSNCEYKSKCHKGESNRQFRLNKELTAFHKEAIANLESTKGALLRMNRSIQAEGTYGILKWDRGYKRAYRRGINNVILEFVLISCGFNLYKYNNKKQKQIQIA